MNPLYIFDLDGTIALNKHREHLIQGDHKNWEAFFEACDMDDPNHPVINTLKSLKNSGADIWIWSGRSDAVREKTLEWLHKHDLVKHVSRIRMREDGDHTPDEELKLGWLNDLSQSDEHRLVAVFDDRDKVVAMWRSQGIACFQVAYGSF